MIYFVFAGGDAIYLLTIYAKGVKENLADADKQVIRHLIAEIESVPHPEAEA